MRDSKCKLRFKFKVDKFSRYPDSDIEQSERYKKNAKIVCYTGEINKRTTAIYIILIIFVMSINSIQLSI